MAEDVKYWSKRRLENDEVTVEAGRVKGWGWDPDGMTYVRQTVDENGVAATGNLLSQYILSDVDDNNPRYAGYLRSDGAYYIVKSERTDDITTHRYSKGSSGYAAAWANRPDETYNYFDVEF
jgi:hypothetical protein